MPVKLTLAFLLLMGTTFAQQITIGPLVTPDKCVPIPGLTTACMATDGIHVSFGGKPFGGALCDSTNPACIGPKGDKGDPGVGVKGDKGDKGDDGAQGIQGIPGVVVGMTFTMDQVCPKGAGTVQSGWKTTGCTYKVVAIQ